MRSTGGSSRAVRTWCCSSRKVGELPGACHWHLARPGKAASRAWRCTASQLVPSVGVWFHVALLEACKLGSRLMSQPVPPGCCHCTVIKRCRQLLPPERQGCRSGYASGPARHGGQPRQRRQHVDRGLQHQVGGPAVASTAARMNDLQAACLAVGSLEVPFTISVASLCTWLRLFPGRLNLQRLQRVGSQDPCAGLCCRQVWKARRQALRGGAVWVGWCGCTGCPQPRIGLSSTVYC